LVAEETSVWLAGKVRTTSGAMLWPDSAGTFDLEMKDADGVSLGEKPPLGTDTKSLEFSGEQKSVFRSVIPFPPIGGKLKVELDVKIPEDGNGEDSTLIRHGTQWELRYLARTTSCVFIVWHDSNVFTEVKVPMTQGKWEEVVAEYNGEELILSVGKASAKAVPKDALRQETSPAHLLVGASSSKVSEDATPRLFQGSLANIRISLE
jgi:hypothetical protein